MYVASSRSERYAPDATASGEDVARHQRSHGGLDLAFASSAGTSRVSDLFQRSPIRALFPRGRAGDPPLAVLVNTAGGLAGGDSIAVSVVVAEGASATMTTQAAEKVYRSLGPDARVEARLSVGADARLEWLPQETILFDGACLDRSISAEIAATGRLLACETLVFGRAARGESMTHGRVREFWRIERAGRLAWVDRLGVADGIAARLDSLGFGGARALATVVYAGPDAATLVPTAREVAEGDGGGATLVNGILVARLLGVHPARVRGALTRLVGELRRAAFGLPACVPGIWAV